MVNLKDAHKRCKDYGGFLPIPRSNAEMDQFLKWFRRERTGSKMLTSLIHSLIHTSPIQK